MEATAFEQRLAHLKQRLPAQAFILIARILNATMAARIIHTQACTIRPAQ
jgi:hypothetical protein